MALLQNLFGLQAQTPGQPSGLQRLLDPSVALPMAAGLLGNQGNSQNLANAFALAAPGFQQQKELQAQTAEKNRTLDFFRAQAPEYAQMIAAGMPVGEAWQTYTQQRFAQPKATDDIQEYQYARDNGMFDGSFTDWQTKGVRDQDPTFGRERDTRKDYDTDPNVQNYKKVRDSYERVRASAAIDSGPGDLALIFNYMKMLDPGSVVREGEFATAQNSGGVSETVRNTYNRIISGERLSPELRGQFVNAADRLYVESSGNLDDTNRRFSQIATDWQLDPSRIVQQPEVYQPLNLGETKNLGNGITIRKIK